MRILITGLLAAFLFSCDPCSDCDRIRYEPVIKVKFINQTRIKQLDVEIASATEQTVQINKELAKISDTLTYFNRRLKEVQDSIKNGHNTGNRLTIINNQIASFTAKQKAESDKKKTNDDLVAKNNKEKALINTGKVKVNQILVVETGRDMKYTDSLTSFDVPLALKKTFKKYKVTIDKVAEPDTFEVDYNTFEQVDANRNLLIKARDIKVVKHSFEGIVNCEENCVDGEASFTFYF